MVDITLMPEETAQILRQREALAPKLDEQRARLLEQLDELNQNRLTLNYGLLPRELDAATLEAVKRVQQIGITAKNQFGDAQPFMIPTRLCFEVVRALRGDVKPKIVTGDIRVPGARDGKWINAFPRPMHTMRRAQLSAVEQRHGLLPAMQCHRRR